MKVNAINDLNFTARSLEIKDAQQIVRLINTKIPTASISKFQRFDNINNNPDVRELFDQLFVSSELMLYAFVIPSSLI